jgi:hypothetical protein
MENPADAFQFRNRLGEVFHEKILPGLEILFDEIGTDDRLIRMDQLAIDLGNIEVKNWENDLAEKAIQQIRQALLMENPVWKIQADYFKLNTEVTNNNQTKNINPTEELKEADFMEGFFLFLKTGRLPWYTSNKTILEEQLLKSINNESALEFKEQLKTLNDVEITRLIYQFDEQLLNELMKHLLPQQKSSFYNEFIEATKFLKTYFTTDFKNTITIKKVLYLPFFNWFTIKDTIDVHIFYSKELAALLQIELINIIHQQGFSTILGKEKNTILKKVNELVLVPVISTFIKKGEIFKNKKHEFNSEELYVENAGLILLHPFLHPFFKEIQLTKDDLFIDDYARMKAVLFTQHLVYGTTIFEEHQLTLNKILCGFQIDEPIIKELEIKPEEKAAANDLLQQVTQLWKKNNLQINASIEGLQQSFLQRPGKLVQKDNNWNLQVEQKTYDMLLSSLPWGIGIIKTPWMDGMLWVAWA